MNIKNHEQIFSWSLSTLYILLGNISPKTSVTYATVHHIAVTEIFI